MTKPFHIDIDYKQKNHHNERICGDVVLTKKIVDENRIIVVLSDGMGHGVKANVLATLTSTMALNFTKEHKDNNKIAEIITKTLPVCSQRKISYSTFTIIDIEINGKIHILEYDNPETILIKDNKLFTPKWQSIILKKENCSIALRSCSFYPEKEDRIIFGSDGITQSGLGSDKYPFGWGLDNSTDYIFRLLKNKPNISANQLASKVINMAYKNDNYEAKDDISCVSLYFRKPRKLLICTGPPYLKEKDKELAEKVKNFDGKKIISGATTSDIIAREFDEEIEDSFEFNDEDLPPISSMGGVDLITEGILTLSKVANILKDYDNNYVPGKGAADKIIRLIKESDEIHFIIGTRINIAHQDPNLPVELEIRRTVVKKITQLLEKKFLKEINVMYI
ncbi:MAG: SpoIIE family protein phosphatase [Bacteroidales bacterium]|jgi:hypothetical protein|nr:SpoIIE family protein phosphatase [Bacteroidales bacterium]